LWKKTRNSDLLINLKLNFHIALQDVAVTDFSSIAIDQGHEQLNKILKGTGGVIGLTQDPIALLN